MSCHSVPQYFVARLFDVVSLAIFVICQWWRVSNVKHLCVINVHGSESELVSVIFCSCGGEMGFSETGECVAIIFMIMRWLCLAVHLHPWNRLLKKVVWKRACGLEDGYGAVFFVCFCLDDCIYFSRMGLQLGCWKQVTFVCITCCH